MNVHGVLVRVGAAVGLLGLSIAGLVVRPYGASAAPGDVVGHVYVNNNTAGMNTISGFDRHADGTLTPIPGSPFPAGGGGIGQVTGSQGALQLSGDGNYLLAVDSGSSEISVLRIAANGSLSLVGRPVSSWGLKPVSLAVHGKFVYVANIGGGGSNYTGFVVDPDGKIWHIPNSTVDIPDVSQVGQILFSDDGKHFAGMRVGPDAGPSFIDSFQVTEWGTLTRSSGSPFPSSHIGPFGSQFSPTNSQLLFVTNAHDGASKGSVSSYRVTADGALSEIAGSPVGNGESGTCWLELSHDGRYAFAVNTGTTSISRYSIATDGRLTLLGNTPFQGPSGLGPFDARLDPSGRYLYVVDARRGMVSAFAVDGGNVMELPSSPMALPAGVTPFGMVVN